MFLQGSKYMNFLFAFPLSNYLFPGYPDYCDVIQKL